MFKQFALSLVLSFLPFEFSQAITSIDTDLVNKNVVFFFEADATGHVQTSKLVATGFLIMVPAKNGDHQYPLLVTARHVVDPVWAECASTNPTKLFARVNTLRFDPETDQTGVEYIPVELTNNGNATWVKSDNESVDVAVLQAPKELLSGKYNVRFVNFRNFGSTEEIAKLGIGSQVASTGLVPGVEGRKRNHPIFKFGKIANIPDEMPTIPCEGNSQLRPFHIWWIAISLVPGNSGSPIYFDPLFPPGADLSAGEPRAMIIGLQSLAVTGADLAGMTPTADIIDVIRRAVPKDAEFRIGLPPK